MTSSAGDDDHAAAAPGADPVLGQAHRLGGARAGRVHLGVGPAGADVLGELRVAHGEDAEEEAAIEDEAVLVEERSVSWIRRSSSARAAAGVPLSPSRDAQVPEHGELVPAAAVHVVSRQLLGEGVEAGEGARRRSRPCRPAARREATSGRAASVPRVVVL